VLLLQRSTWKSSNISNRSSTSSKLPVSLYRGTLSDTGRSGGSGGGSSTTVAGLVLHAVRAGRTLGSCRNRSITDDVIRIELVPPSYSQLRTRRDCRAPTSGLDAERVSTLDEVRPMCCEFELDSLGCRGLHLNVVIVVVDLCEVFTGDAFDED